MEAVSSGPKIRPVDEHLAHSGRVMEILSEHTCQGWLEGYLLTGRHGLFSCYEAFIHLVDSMFNQHAKWLKTTRDLAWRPPISSLNYLLSSHVWRQDHNGFSHQDPGFIDHVVNKKAEVVRVYLPPDTNTLLSTMQHCLASQHYVNVVVAGKQPSFDWLDAEAADLHCARGARHLGLGLQRRRRPRRGDRLRRRRPDPGGAGRGRRSCASTCPTLRIRFVNVVDLMRLQDEREHPHGLSDRDFDTLFTTDKPVVFAYHGYPWLIHRLTYRRTNHHNLHVRGYKEEGTTTTPFDMVMMNDIDRYHLVMDVIDRVPGLGSRAALLRQQMVDTRRRARRVDPRARRRPARGAGVELERAVLAAARALAVDHRRGRDGRDREPTLSSDLRPAVRTVRYPDSAGPETDLAGDRELLVGGDDEHGRRGSRRGRSGAGRSASASLRAGSTAMPSRARPARASARSRATCSPTPAVKTTASAPPSTAR